MVESRNVKRIYILTVDRMIKTKLHSNRHFYLMHFAVMGTKDGFFCQFLKENKMLVTVGMMCGRISSPQ